jgi:zinc transport system permease protein
MLDDFFVRALLAGLGVAAVTGPLGCFIVWRRMAYFGDTLAHSALLGIALGLLLQVEPAAAVFTVAALVALALSLLQDRIGLSADAVLGLLSHGALAVGLVVLAFLTWVRVDLMSFLFGDILAVSRADLAVIAIGGAGVLLALAWVWRPLFAATVNRDLAAAEGMNPRRAELVFSLLLAATVAICIKIVGVLLVTAMLIIPAAAVRPFASGPEAMALAATGAGAISVIVGLYSSLVFDTPSGPSIVVAAVVLFLAGLAGSALRAAVSERQG